MPACGCQFFAGVFGVEPGLDGVIRAVGGGSASQSAAVGDMQLQLDEVQPCGGLGDGVLDLQAGVHLEEEEVAGLVGHELDGARTGVADGLRRQPRGIEKLGAHALRSGRPAAREPLR